MDRVKKISFKKIAEQKKSMGFLRIFIFVFLCIGIFVIAFFSYFANKNIDISRMTFQEFFTAIKYGNINEANTQVINEMYFDSGSNLSYAIYRDYILEASKYGLRFIDKKFKQLHFEPFAMNRPVVKTQGMYISVADMGGKDVYIFNGSTKLWNKTLDNNILSVDISSNGYVLVVHEETRYKSAVTMFNLKGDVIFTLGKAENFIVMARIAPDGDRFVLNELNASNIKIKSILEFADISGKLDENQIILENTIVTNVGYLNNGFFAALGDTGLKIYDRNKTEKRFFGINGKLFGGAVIDEQYIAVAASEEENKGIYNNSKTRVNIYDKDAIYSSFVLEQQIKNISGYRNIIGLNTGRSVYCFNLKGKYLGNFESKQEINGLDFFDDTNLMVVGKSILQIIKMD